MLIAKARQNAKRLQITALAGLEKYIERERRLTRSADAADRDQLAGRQLDIDVQ